MSVVPIISGMIDLIDENIVAKSNLIANALTGEILVGVENSFHFSAGQEIVIIDYGYNDPASPHYDKFEYASIKEVNNTHWITLSQPIQDPLPPVGGGGWMVANHAFIQKTIGSSPLYSDNIYYGDRDVIPTIEMAVTVEPQSLSNEWLYIHGGLSEEYRVGIMIYGKDINTEEGMQILNKYTDAIYDLFNRQIHIDIDNNDAKMMANVAAGTSTVYIENDAGGVNLQTFIPSHLIPMGNTYEIQDNLGNEIDLWLHSVDSLSVPGQLKLTVYLNDPVVAGTGLNNTIQRAYTIAEYAVFIRHNRYFYDSRIDNIEYGMVQKGSAFIRAARLNWFGKEITEYRFPQRSLGVPYFPQVGT